MCLRLLRDEGDWHVAWLEREFCASDSLRMLKGKCDFFLVVDYLPLPLENKHIIILEEGATDTNITYRAKHPKHEPRQ